MVELGPVTRSDIVEAIKTQTVIGGPEHPPTEMIVPSGWWDVVRQWPRDVSGGDLSEVMPEKLFGLKLTLGDQFEVR